jgi:serine/threonine protein kinase
VSAPLIAPGSMLASRWIIGGLLGRNETAEVYEAEEASQRRFVALKLFDRAFAVEPTWSEHVARTRALSKLTGDAIARAYDLGIESSLGRPYIASERITFPTLSRYVSERGPLPLRVLAPALTTLAAALDAAHGASIVHGGLKPQNLFVSFDDPHWARITDFSLSRLRAAVGRGPSALLGWSAPETADGQSTPASDRYALALVCFFAATGVPWHNALHAVAEPKSDRVRLRVASERAKSQGGELDPLFDPWFERALATDPNARFASAAEMARSFVELFTGAPTAEMPARPSLSPHAGTLPLAGSKTPVPGTKRADKMLADTLPFAASGSDPLGASATPGARVSSLPPPRASGSAPPVPKTVVPPWLWLACAAIALLAMLSIWWLGRH